MNPTSDAVAQFLTDQGHRVLVVEDPHPSPRLETVGLASPVYEPAVLGDREELAQLQRAKARVRAAAAQRARIVARTPLYARAIAALRDLALAGGDPREGWVKELAPLTREERELCRAELVKHAQAAQEALHS